MVELLPEKVERFPRGGAVGSVQEAVISFPNAGASIPIDDFLAHAAPAYWRLVSRTTLGAVRVVDDPDGPAVFLLVRPLMLLRFRTPVRKAEAESGSITWPIDHGLLVSRRGRRQGFLQMAAESVPSSGAAIHVRLEVRNFYPWLRGSGRLAGLGSWIYARTQLRLHRLITRRFLRSLAD